MTINKTKDNIKKRGRRKRKKKLRMVVIVIAVTANQVVKSDKEPHIMQKIKGKKNFSFLKKKFRE